MREHDGGDVVVVEFRVLELRPAEQAIRELSAGGDGDGCEFDLAAHVAERVDALDVGVLVFVGLDVALVVLLHAGFFQSEVLDFGRAADGPEEAVDVERCAVGVRLVFVVERHPAVAFVGVLFELGLRGLPVDVDALALVLFGDGFLDHGVEVS